MENEFEKYKRNRKCKIGNAILKIEKENKKWKIDSEKMIIESRKLIM